MNYNNLIFIQARTPEKLKDELLKIGCTSEIVPGSWYHNGMMFGVWVILDRPATMISKKKKDLTTN